MATRQIEPRREAIGTGRIEKGREREKEREREQWPDGANAFDSIVIVRVYRNKFPG